MNSNDRIIRRNYKIQIKGEHFIFISQKIVNQEDKNDEE